MKTILRIEGCLLNAGSHAGLTKVPIDGQPRSIVRDLEEMARTYIKVNLLLLSHCSLGAELLRSRHSSR